MKKRVLSVLLCAVMAVSLLAGCGSGNSDNVGESESDKAYVQDKGTLVVASQILSQWIIRMKAASGSDLTQILPENSQRVSGGG